MFLQDMKTTVYLNDEKRGWKEVVEGKDDLAHLNDERR